MRILVQFDGSNFYRKVKRLFPSHHVTDFDYRGFACMLAQAQPNQIAYYVGEIRQYHDEPKSTALFVGQQRLLHHLKAQGVVVKLGYLLRSAGVFHEKGVDVQIAVDLVRGTIKDEFDVVYLVSSDTDLLPAIATAKGEGKQVIYVGFEGFMSRALAMNCSHTRMLTRADLAPFFAQP